MGRCVFLSLFLRAFFLSLSLSPSVCVYALIETPVPSEAMALDTYEKVGCVCPSYLRVLSLSLSRVHGDGSKTC